MSGTEEVTVLVVDDDPSLTEVYAAWLDAECAVRTATDGETALDRLDDAVDVVLLDRRMPGLSGETVLERIRERGLDCRVAMVTGVRPKSDIVRMGFDEYVVKPVTREELAAVVEDLRRRDEYDERLQELFALASKRASLRAEAERGGVDLGGAYDDLEARIADLRESIDATVAEFEHSDFKAAFRDLTTHAERE